MDCACCGAERSQSELIHLKHTADIAICDGCLDGLHRQRAASVDALEVSPIFVTTDMTRALAHYSALGFRTDTYADVYGFMSWGHTNLHIARVDEVDRKASNVACYLYVRDADDVHRRWSESGAGGTFHDPVDTDYGLREGAHIDPDGNLIRYGSNL